MYKSITKSIPYYYDIGLVYFDTTENHSKQLPISFFKRVSFLKLHGKQILYFEIDSSLLKCNFFFHYGKF